MILNRAYIAGEFNPRDGQLYVTGMAGWGTYTTRDGCFQRVRYTGEPVQLPLAWHAVENGVLLTFSRPLDRVVAEQTAQSLRPGLELPLQRRLRLSRAVCTAPGHAGP